MGNAANGHGLAEILKGTDYALTVFTDSEINAIRLFDKGGKTVLHWSTQESTHKRFDEEDLLAIPVPDKVLGVQKQIDGLVNKAIEARIEAARLLEQAKKTVEDLITGGGGPKAK